MYVPSLVPILVYILDVGPDVAVDAGARARATDHEVV
jgi:hypothetical protein